MEYNKETVEYYSYLRTLVEQTETPYWIGNPSVEIINGTIELLPLFQNHKIAKETENCETLDQYL